MAAITEDGYEVSQTATGGPVLPWGGGLTWRDHLGMALLLLLLFVIVTAVTYYNLTQLYAHNPGYGRSLVAERAFCLEVDALFIGTEYHWDDDLLACAVVDVEVRR